jgi:hypothetical protein
VVNGNITLQQAIRMLIKPIAHTIKPHVKLITPIVLEIKEYIYVFKLTLSKHNIPILKNYFFKILQDEEKASPQECALE